MGGEDVVQILVRVGYCKTSATYAEPLVSDRARHDSILTELPWSELLHDARGAET